MRKFITLTLAALCLALQPLSAQKKEGPDNHKFHKAVDILDGGGDPKEARKLAYENIKENPKHIDSYLLIAGIDRNEMDYASALGVIEKAMKNNHQNSGFSEALLLWWKGIIYDELGNTEKAAQTMEEVIRMAKRTDKDHLISMMEDLAQFRYDLKEYDASDKVYKEIMEAEEAALLPRVGLARNMIARGQYDEALAALEECRLFDIDYAEVYRFQMQAYEGKKEYKKMIDAMITLYEKSEDSDYLNVEHFKKNKMYSIAVLKEKIASEKDNALWRLVLAGLYEECYMFSEMLPLLNGILDEYGLDEDLLEARAGCYDEMGMAEFALADINTILEICDESDRAYYHSKRADINRSAGNYKEAIADYDKFIERFPARAYGYYARGWCKELLGNLDEAMKDYDEGIAIDETYPYIYLMRGKGYRLMGKGDLAKADFEMVLSLDTLIHNSSCRQYALCFLGRDDEAAEWMDKIIEKDPDNPGNWYDKACMYARMDRCDEAVEALKTSMEKGCRALAHIDHDGDMDPLRDRDDFRALILQYKEILEQELSVITSNQVNEDDKVVSEIAMRKMYGGTYEVPCSVNGLPLKMIFDTGASDVTISSVEASFMLKNGYLSDNDVKGKTHYMTASGDIHEGTILKLKEVKLGDAVLKNIEASVVHSQKAPLLLGQSVLEKFGTITIDNVNSKLLIKQ